MTERVGARLSDGAASLYVVRVTDGNEVTSALDLYNRLPGTGEYVDRDAGDFAKTLMLEIDAKSGGRWGGAFKIGGASPTVCGSVAGGAFSLTGARLSRRRRSRSRRLLWCLWP